MIFDPQGHPAPYPERAETRPCKSCGERIQPGQSYVPTARGPLHVYCPRNVRPRPGCVR